MIETASSWALPQGSEFRREPVRPAALRQAGFDALFDAYTIFYDCFRISSTQVMLIGPPLNNFAGVLDSLIIHANPSGRPCSLTVDQKFTTAFANRQTHNLCRILVEAAEQEVSLRVQCRAGTTVMEVRRQAWEPFRGRRVLFTQSKNNHPTWICDWMRFHRDLQNADAVLLYDNHSTNYSIAELLDAMKQVSGFRAVSVVQWPYKFGPQGIGRGTWDSSFAQDGVLEDARWRFLGAARAALNCDIDELVLSDKETVFDQAADSATGCVKFSGRWLNAAIDPDQTLPRHRGSTFQLSPRWRWRGLRPKDIHACPTKWAVVPGRCPSAAHWSVHEIVGMAADTNKDSCYRHFSRISTNWKKNRKPIEAADRAQYKEDEKLLQAFAKVNWDA